MEAERFEKKVRDVFEGREISPSGDSWQKLESRMKTQEGNSRSYIWWMAVAAVVTLGFFLVNTWDSGFVQDPGPTVVEETLPVEEVNQKKHGISEGSLVSTPVSGGKKNKAGMVSSLQAEGLERSSSGVIATSLAPLGMKYPSTLKSSYQVSDAEINNLLAIAMAEVEQEQMEQIASAREAERLLEEVEFELEESFRHKVFEVLKEGFSKAKTAVANRNY